MNVPEPRALLRGALLLMLSGWPLLVNAGAANTDLSTYRALGRGYWLRITVRL